MKRLLIVVDMQNDFVTGSLGSLRAEAIVPAVKEKIEEYRKSGDRVIFTRDTHSENYLETQEGKRLPVVHCIKGTFGHQIIDELIPGDCGSDTNVTEVFDKTTFGSIELAKMISNENYDEIELCGLCTDICIVSNALILKATLPETMVFVDAECCAGVTKESHEAALLTMKMCQVIVKD